MFAPVTYPGAFSPVECDQILDLARYGEFADGGLVQRQHDTGIRRARIHWLDDDAGGWVLQRLMQVVAEINREVYAFDLTEFAERMQVAHYPAESAGHFDWHSDIGDGQLAAKRKLTMVVQLSPSETYKGGDLEVSPDTTLRSADRDQGSATLFPSFVLHRVTPVTLGDRYSLTTWVHGPAFR